MKFIRVLFSLIMTLFLGLVIAAPLGANPLLVSGGIAAGSLLVQKQKGVVAYGLLVELWTGELINHFRHMGEWLSRIPSQDNYVNNNSIHLVDVGADPDVLIDNNSYPIATAARTDTDVAVALKKFDTENTKITDDELYALPYDKEGSVIRQHRETLEEQTKAYGLYSLCPSTNGANTPVIETTGGAGATEEVDAGFLDFHPKDLRAVKLKLDNLKVPQKGRILVMCPEHANALIDLDNSFRDKYNNVQTGKVINHFGFEIYEDPDAVLFDVDGDKKAFGTTRAATDRPASVFFYNARAFKAMGSVKMYYISSTMDPKNRETVVGFRLYHIVLPKKNTGFGAIISGPAST